MAKILVAALASKADASVFEVPFETQADLCWYELPYRQQAEHDQHRHPQAEMLAEEAEQRRADQEGDVTGDRDEADPSDGVRS